MLSGGVVVSEGGVTGGSTIALRSGACITMVLVAGVELCMVAESGLTVPVTFLQGCAVTVVGVQALEWSVSGCLYKVERFVDNRAM